MNEPLGDLRARDGDQGRASDPTLSVWVSANAGSGKTHVLVQRVVRLLLERTPPSKLLCLTFTKAAAANMSARVSERLARWTRFDDRQLAAELTELTGRAPCAVDLEHARQLFAGTVETPGGLKIQTIHAFCERLLHLFPFEANVPARFEVIEDLRQAELLGAARSDVLAAANRGGNAQLAEAVATLADETSATEFGEILQATVAQRRVLTEIDLTAHREVLRRALGLEPGFDERSIEPEWVQGAFAPQAWAAVAGTLGEQCRAGRALARAATLQDGPAKREAYLAVFITKAGHVHQTLVPKPVREAHPDLCERLDAEARRILSLQAQKRAAATLRRTQALLAVGQAVAQRYAALKARAGLLDFDDLIARTLTLLRRTGSAWVLYKLDAGVDHILVDEAQDTSPDQWEILKLIAGEFTAGEGARPASRTFFAVGDEKQSIFSFQGAAPRQFSEMRRFFERRISAAAAAAATKPLGAGSFAHVRLNWSFRSAPAVLRCIDRVFAGSENFDGLSFDPAETGTVHQAWKRHLPGHVEVWDTVRAADVPDPLDWSLPVDVPGRTDPVVVLAERIARSVRSWTAPNAPERVHDAEGRARPITAGDILVLVRTRSILFDAVMRALKKCGVAVAGADRMILNEHIAVMDLLAAARAALLRADDLALACVLKSPLIGLDDDALLELAPKRGLRSLADALDAHPKHRRAAATIEAWRRDVRRLTPFDFFMARVTDGARKLFGERLGPEAEDAVDEFLRRALDHEREAPPSMVRFLAAVDAADLEIKRDMEAAGNSVRVMTVHGAKGLEAKIVILADTCSLPTGRLEPKLFKLERGGTGAEQQPLFAWSARIADDPPAVETAREERKREMLREYRRLLYVAMTRAEERLVIAGHEGKPLNDGTPQRPAECWYGMIHGALAPELIKKPAPWDPGESIWVYTDREAFARTSPELAAPAPRAGEPLPEWARRRAAPETRPSRLRPSHGRPPSGGSRPAADAGPSVDAQARLLGRVAHTLLQYLPDLPLHARAEAAQRFALAKVPADVATRVAAAALRIVDDPALAPLFAAGSRAEVAVAGNLPRADGTAVRINGRIDRLAVLEHEVWIADFKTGEPKPAMPPAAHVEQLATYRALVAQLYPTKRVRTFLVRTLAPSITELQPEQLDTALTGALART